MLKFCSVPLSTHCRNSVSPSPTANSLIALVNVYGFANTVLLPGGFRNLTGKRSRSPASATPTQAAAATCQPPPPGLQAGPTKWTSAIWPEKQKEVPISI